MKALVYTAPRTIEIADVLDPMPEPGEVVVAVEAVGICGSDMHAYHGHDERRPAPLVLGHEAAGRIMDGPRAGERITINPLVTCGHCQFCTSGSAHLCRKREIISMPPRPGAFAERVRVPDANAIAVPENCDITIAALTEPMAVAWHSVCVGTARLYRPLAASRCVVLGGGAIGLASALVLRHFGARDLALAEPNALRRATVSRAGIAAYDPAGGAAPESGSAALVIDAVGAGATRADACRLVAPGGTIVHVGLLPGAEGIDIRRITLQEITLIGSYCYTPLDFSETVAALLAGDFGAPDWVEQRPLNEGGQAFQDLDAGRVAAAKLMLRP